ncbi:hypothetical protein GGTG_13533 [Gaeumannomyces tritici R3-111a-1]|uniref:Zn(2)-C6 fungal-type domain-containing protein n=1 Tax=Gaeumannomyces tritici (strain R3-111a-1) TaxID=644352 RepID=J3PJ51_GAET3|nr:hypothetical protein GGTG_13533 [Gaeumannomyces tritici R3-111a-1]EJT68945.1 hypothetical protein GGTG_13533 [Gaeumannomyces tritici R3-111a-1]
MLELTSNTRCSGYQTAADRKCFNCKKTGNQCVFQPVNPGFTFFVPIPTIQDGVTTLGTHLVCPFGQPMSSHHFQSSAQQPSGSRSEMDTKMLSQLNGGVS